MDTSAARRPSGRLLLSRFFAPAALAAGLLLSAATPAPATPAGPAGPSAQDPARAEADAKRAFDAGRFQEAGEKYARAAESAATPERKSDLAFQSGWAYFIAGNSKAARDSLRLAFLARPNLDVVADFYSPDFVRLAQSVRTEVAGGVAAPSIDMAELKRTAREKLADGKAEEALYDLKKAESSTDPQVHRLLADAFERLARGPEADAARRRASELEKSLVTTGPISTAPSGPGGPPVQGPASAAGAVPVIENAEALLKASDYRGARAAASRALELDPKSAEAHRIVGDAAFALGQEGDAEREYTAALVLDTANSRSEFGLGRLAERQAKWNTAASHYRRALELSGKNVQAALGLGRTMDELKDRSAARIAYGRAIEIDPASAEARNDFGVFLFRSDQADRSVEELMEAVRLAPARAIFHENLGRAFRRKQMWREAERELSEAARLAPNETVVWECLGEVRTELKKPDDAASAFRVALDLDPSNEAAAAGLAGSLLDAGRLGDAEMALVKALENNGRSAVLWNNLGVIRTRKGALSGALAAFQRAIAEDSSFQPAKANLARAEQLAALDRAGI
ncbi:MAG: tetratricopeptide repeat protein [Acidobacteriota bacterium]|nr:tetratricopeptide repeat protein [Acidobacteriota bacterium]